MNSCDLFQNGRACSAVFGSKNFAQGGKDAHRVGACNPVVNGLGLAAGGHEPRLSQFGKVLRCSRLRQAKMLGQIGNRAFSFHQLAHNQQPLFVGELLQKIERLVAAARQLQEDKERGVCELVAGAFAEVKRGGWSVRPTDTHPRTIVLEQVGRQI